MDIESLKFFIEVRNSGNITNTANAFYVTQSAVSKRLSMLEAELGVQLFQRGKGRSRAVITPAGESFAEIAERILLLHRQALSLKCGAERRTLTIACINSVQDYILPPFITEIQRKDRNLCVTIEDHHSVEIFPLLEKKMVDIGITQAPAPFPDLRSLLLFQEGYRVVMRPSGTGLHAGAVHPEQLPAEHEIFEAFDSEFQHWHDYWWRPSGAKIRVNTTPTAERYFSDPEDWIIVPDSVAVKMELDGFVSFALTVTPPVHRCYLVCGKDNGDASVEGFVEEALAYFKGKGRRY